MPKKASSDLPDLISSLTKNEAGYFKKFSARHSGSSDKDYLRLFDQLSGKHIPAKENVFKNQSRLKNYLHQSILLSLESYHGNSSSNSKLRGYLADIELLYGKALYSQCKKVLKKANALAVRYEKFNTMVELIGWEIRILQAAVELDTLQKKSGHFFTALKTAFDKMQNVTGYLILYARIYGLIRKIGPSRSNQDKKLYREIVSNPLMAHIGMARSAYAQMLFYHIRSVYYFSCHDAKRERENTELLIRKIEINQTLLEEETERYLIALNNHISSSIRLRLFEKIPQEIKKLRSLRLLQKRNPYSLNLSHRIFARAFIQELYFHNTAGDPENALRVISENEKEFKKIRPRINIANETELSFRVAYSYFMAGEFKRAQLWLNKVLTNKATRSIRQFYSYSLLLNLCLHYQMRNYGYAEYLADQCKKELKRIKELHPFESQLINCISELIRLGMDAKQEKVKTLTRHLDSLKKHPDKILSDHFDVLSWLESQRTGRPFTETVQKYPI